jgi:hypothetical protein
MPLVCSIETLGIELRHLSNTADQCVHVVEKMNSPF